MQNPTPILENDTHKFPRDFYIQTDHYISARRRYLIITNNKKKKRTSRIVDFAIPALHRVKLKENEKKDKYLDLTKELKKTVEHESDVYTNYNCSSWYSQQMINKGAERIDNKRSEDHPNYCITEIGHNTENNSRGQSRLIITQTPVKDHQLTLM